LLKDPSDGQSITPHRLPGYVSITSDITVFLWIMLNWGISVRTVM